MLRCQSKSGHLGSSSLRLGAFSLPKKITLVKHSSSRRKNEISWFTSDRCAPECTAIDGSEAETERAPLQSEHHWCGESQELESPRYEPSHDFCGSGEKRRGHY